MSFKILMISPCEPRLVLHFLEEVLQTFLNIRLRLCLPCIQHCGPHFDAQQMFVDIAGIMSSLYVLEYARGYL